MRIALGCMWLWSNIVLLTYVIFLVNLFYDHHLKCLSTLVNIFVALVDADFIQMKLGMLMNYRLFFLVRI